MPAVMLTSMTCCLWRKDGLTEIKNMKRIGRNKGFTIVELLTVLAILVILAGALLKVAKYVRDRASEGLTESTITVIVTALEQYHDDNGKFPFEADVNFVTVDLQSSIETDLGLAANEVTITATNDDEYASIEAMVYFLNRSYNSSQILSAISGKFITSKDSNGGALTAEWPVGGDTKTIPLIRIVDVWGYAFRYAYASGESFPVIVSAGQDGDFSTAGDNISSDDL